MRVAVINQYSSAGGGARFTRALVRALAADVPGVSVGLFADAENMERDGLVELFAEMPNVEIVPIHNSLTAADGGEGGPASAPRPVPSGRYLRLRGWLKRIGPVARLYYRVARNAEVVEPTWTDFALDEEAQERLRVYDVIYLAWPYFIEPADLAPPVVCTIHDFNFKYPFGNYTRRMVEVVERQLAAWIGKAQAVVVSARFMLDELERFYPGRARDVSVVRLSTFAISDPTPEEVASVQARYGLPARYVVCASNTAKHKNLPRLFEALAKLKASGSLVPLVLTGHGTGDIGRHGERYYREGHPLRTYHVIARLMAENDLRVGREVFPLGYLPDADVDAVIRGAALVVSPSLYEAGSGPALDAWSSGTPVAFSNIPPFVEHFDALGVQAWTFDPNDPVDIADVLAEALTSERSAQMAAVSKAAIAKRTWAQVAREYADVFQEAIDAHASKRADRPSAPLA